jgi:hypothetical protein
MGLRPWCACRLSPGWNAVFYWGLWAISIIGIGIIGWAALKSKRWARWTTQDILIVAALGVLLEVYDNIIGDQLIGPLINPIPGADFSQVQDLPYLFLLLVGVALVRKPGWTNGLFNGIEGGVSAILAHRVAVSVVPSLGASRAKPGADPFAEPAGAPAGALASPEPRPGEGERA